MTELCVVFGILAILLSLVLVAVQSSREAARQVTCSSNLRQLSIASDLHVNRHGHIVSNGWGFNWGPAAEAGVGRSQPAGWIYQLSADLASAAAERFASSEPPAAAEHPVLSVVRCPSRPAPLRGPATTVIAPVNYEWSAQVPKTDYAINEGDTVSFTKGGPANQLHRVVSAYDWVDSSLPTGVSFQRSELPLSAIRDGLSHTYLVGEKHVYASAYATADDRGYDQSCWSGVDVDLNRWTNIRPRPDARHAVGRQFGSAHSGVWMVVFCDGSVRRLTYSIDLETHQRNGNRRDNGGNVNDDPFTG